jgi:hypothetical protein
MPDNQQSSPLDYQPKTKAYAFSTTPVAPKKLKPEQKTKGETNPILLLAFEICGLIAIFVILLLLLNFFNILSLSKIYPSQLGWLPHISTSSSNSNYTPVDTSSITTKDTVDKINTYKTYNVPNVYYSKQDNSMAAGGIFAGYGKNTILVISSNNTLVLNFDAKTVFEEASISVPQGSSAATMGFNPYSDFNSFIKNVSFGKYVQVYYNQAQSSVNKTLTKVDYLPSHKL